MKSKLPLLVIGIAAFACALEASSAHAQLGRAFSRARENVSNTTGTTVKTPGWVPQYKPNPGGNATSGTTIGSAPVTSPRRTVQPAQQPRQVYQPTQSYTARGKQVYQSQNGSKAYVPQYTPPAGGFARPTPTYQPPQPTARGAAAMQAKSGIELYNKVYGSGPRKP
jgi:hypothetical protein